MRQIKAKPADTPTRVLIASPVRRGWVWTVQAVVFALVPLDELVTAWLGIAPVLPRFQRWRQRLVVEWRAYRAGAVEGELMDGVWR